MQHFIGCDVHTRNQVVAWIEEETGEIKKRRLEHEGEEVQRVLRAVSAGDGGGDRSDVSGVLVRAVAGRVGARVVGGRRGAHSGQRSTLPEDGLRATPSTFWICCARGGSRASGFPPWKSATCGSCWCIG